MEEATQGTLAEGAWEGCVCGGAPSSSRAGLTPVKDGGAGGKDSGARGSDPVNS